MKYIPTNTNLQLSMFAKLAAVLVISAVICGSSMAQSPTDLRRTPIVRAIEKAKPSVVNIEGKKTVRNDNPNTPQKKFKQVKGMGTGVVIDERGYILTNFHVVDGISRIEVRLSDKTQTTARLIAHSAKTDLAIIKVDLERPLKVIDFGTSSDIMEGEFVIAIGNAYGYRHSSTRGIVSALGRNVPISNNQVYYDLIQTDAPINPGNSGGPLLNINGDCIGINAAVRVGAQGIAFAIPINSALEVAADLMKRSQVNKVAVGFETVTTYVNHKPQLVVKSVQGNQSSGLRQGDVIQSIRKKTISRRLELERALFDISSGQDIELGIKRGNETLVATVGVQPYTRNRQPVGQDFRSLSWEMLGLELVPIPKNEFRQISQNQNGGMRVMRVRPNGPSGSESIKPGDVLIGIHNWETTSKNDVEFILKQKEVIVQDKVRYDIIRGKSALWGRIHVALRHDNKRVLNLLK